MSMNVLERLLPRVLEASGVVRGDEWLDLWLDPDYNPTKISIEDFMKMPVRSVGEYIKI